MYTKCTTIYLMQWSVIQCRTPALVEGSLHEIYRGSVLDKTIFLELVNWKIGLPECKQLWTPHYLKYMHFLDFKHLHSAWVAHKELPWLSEYLSTCIYVYLHFFVFGKLFAHVFYYFQPHVFRTILTKCLLYELYSIHTMQLSWCTEVFVSAAL